MTFIAFLINTLNNAGESGHPCLTPFWIQAVPIVVLMLIMVSCIYNIIYILLISMYYTDSYWLFGKWHTIIVFVYLNLIFMMKITVPIISMKNGEN